MRRFPWIFSHVFEQHEEGSAFRFQQKAVGRREEAEIYAAGFEGAIPMCDLIVRQGKKKRDKLDVSRVERHWYLEMKSNMCVDLCQHVRSLSRQIKYSMVPC